MANRLFVALLPPAVVRTELSALVSPLVGVRSSPAENLHLTLRFIGETDEEKLGLFAESLDRVRVEPFVLPVGGLGFFPARGTAKILWAGAGRGHTRLYQLRKQVDEALLAVDAGLATPGFFPHFLLGRLGRDHDPKHLAHFLKQHAAFEAPPFRVAEFHLLASELTPGRPPNYRALRTFALRMAGPLAKPAEPSQPALRATA